MSAVGGLGWPAILRLGLVQTALGAIVVLTTSTLNRVMVVELALPALVPGLLVGLHYALQLTRPRFGHGSDVHGRRTPWIIGGIVVLAVGGMLAATATALMPANLTAGLALAALGFAGVGLGVGAAGTSLLALLARHVAPARRAPAATAVWLMMIFGMAVTAGVAGSLLDPFSPARLIVVCGTVAVAAVALTVAAVWGIERRQPVGGAADARPGDAPFMAALREVWAEPAARRFTIFLFVSMLAYSAQDLILEPFAGIVFGLTPGQTTSLSSFQNGGVLIGMLAVAFVGGRLGRRGSTALRPFVVAGCVASAVALAALAAAGSLGQGFPLRPAVMALGIANGIFAAAAIGAMMELAGADGGARSGLRMGLWGAAQGIAFGLGGLAGTASVDLASLVLGARPPAYALTFAAEAVLFLVAAVLARRLGGTATVRPSARDVTSTAPLIPAGLAGASGA